ncbi:MAG: SsrA-binding protein SmpB [Cyanobacteria bacterium MAG CAR4_bin_6]|nr:SsrA-binding protein SmpB [Cyanobacteria bacterium MAG CAR4_bin_6]MCY4234738.1 SsrA-binding protein SmpB [Cyanobacteria bacterium MAG CAR2_bin_4]
MARCKTTRRPKGGSDRSTVLAENRLARHQYDILETLETGLELLGTEVKSIRAGKANLRDGFCLVRDGQLWLHNVHISPHQQAGSYFNHEPLRARRMLAQRREINRLEVGVAQKGLTLVPLNLHLKGSWIKLSLALGRGRKLHDKRRHDRTREDRQAMRAVLGRP